MTLWTDAAPPAEFIPTRTITTSWLLLVVRLTDNALARLTLLWAVPSSATALDPELVLVLLEEEDCIIASTNVTPFWPTLVEKEYCCDD